MILNGIASLNYNDEILTGECILKKREQRALVLYKPVIITLDYWKSCNSDLLDRSYIFVYTNAEEVELCSRDYPLKERGCFFGIDKNRFPSPCKDFVISLIEKANRNTLIPIDTNELYIVEGPELFTYFLPIIDRLYIDYSTINASGTGERLNKSNFTSIGSNPIDDNGIIILERDKKPISNLIL